MTSTVWGLFWITVCLEVWGQTAFKKGTLSTSSLVGPAFWCALAGSPWIIAGLAGYTIEACLWVYVLGHGPLSVVGPMSALAYVGAVACGRLFLGEAAGWRRWAGAGLVTAGAALLGSSLR